MVIIAIVTSMKCGSLMNIPGKSVDDKLISLSTKGAIFLIEEGIRVASCREMTASGYVGNKNSCRMLSSFPFFVDCFRNIQERSVVCVVCSQ